jgi:hypothetical protein
MHAMPQLDLRQLLDTLDDDLALLTSGDERANDPMVTAWRAAVRAAHAAYDEWRDLRNGESYAGYLAAADRVDAAQDALAVRALERR